MKYSVTNSLTCPGIRLTETQLSSSVQTIKRHFSTLIGSAHISQRDSCLELNVHLHALCETQFSCYKQRAFQAQVAERKLCLCSSPQAKTSKLSFSCFLSGGQALSINLTHAGKERAWLGKNKGFYSLDLGWLSWDPFIFKSTPPKKFCSGIAPGGAICTLLRALCTDWANSPLGTAVSIPCGPSAEPVNSFGLGASGSIAFPLPPRHHNSAHQLTFEQPAINEPFSPLNLWNSLFIPCLWLVKMVSLLFLLISIHNNSIFHQQTVCHPGYTGLLVLAKEPGILGRKSAADKAILQQK